MVEYKKTVGTQGEQLVVESLQKKGFNIKARNFTKSYGEIDIIAQKDDLLLFIEVKNRHNPLFDMTELITRSKQRKIIATAKAYLLEQSAFEMGCRFDVALVTESATIEYIENAFTESG